MAFTALKTEFLASNPMQQAHDQIMAGVAGQPALVTGGTTLRQLVLLIAGRIEAALLDCIAEALTGLKWPAMLTEMHMRTCSAALGAKIEAPTKKARTGWRAHFNAFKTTYTAATLGTDGGKRMLIKGLIECLEPELLKWVPGTEHLVAAVEPMGNKLVDIICEAAEKVERGGAKKKPAAPTEATEASDGTLQGNCFRCGKPGHKRSECTSAAKEQDKSGKRDGRSKSRGQEVQRDGQRDTVRCATCGLTNDHYTRKCPDQTCLSCGAKGHAKVDCKPPGKRRVRINPPLQSICWSRRRSTRRWLRSSR